MSSKSKIKSPLRVLTRADLAARGIRYSTGRLRELYNEGKFPKPRRLSERKLVWAEHEIESWLKARLKSTA